MKVANIVIKSSDNNTLMGMGVVATDNLEVALNKSKSLVEQVYRQVYDEEVDENTLGYTQIMQTNVDEAVVYVDSLEEEIFCVIAKIVEVIE